jgi:hypothetical protein
VFGDILASDYGINGDGSAKKIEPTAKPKKSYLEDFKNL